MSKGLLFSHPTGNANVRAAVNGLLEAGMLGEFHTTIASYPGNIWDKLGKKSWGRELQRRSFDERIEPYTIQHPARELGRMLASRLKLESLKRHETGLFCIDAVYRSLDQAAAKRLRKKPELFTGVYAYEDGGLESFRAAKKLNLRRIYDLPIAYWQTLRQLLAEEAERLPAWKVTLAGGISDSEAKLARKTEELELAEMVMCPSQFVARSIPESLRRQKTIVMAPFGSPVNIAGQAEAPVPTTGRLRVLFAGSLTQRKGLGDLMAAVQLLKRSDVELVVMGAPQAPVEFYRKQFDGFTHEASRPHAEVLKLMRSCHVFCLPSIVEGRALVMQEALSQGLPLIITPNTGGEDLIDEGITGFLVPIRQPEKIAEKIAWFADHRRELVEMSVAAKKKAAQLTWHAYGRLVSNAIMNFNP
jgi:glycosyltransferase involved in cell wall biosynthesis